MGEKEGRLDYVGVEVVPRRVGLLDESDFPGTLPFLEPVLAGDGGFHGGVSLVPDEAVYVVSLGESVGEVFLCCQMRWTRLEVTPV